MHVEFGGETSWKKSLRRPRMKWKSNVNFDRKIINFEEGS
jgi:hypothetical protein